MEERIQAMITQGAGTVTLDEHDSHDNNGNQMTTKNANTAAAGAIADAKTDGAGLLGDEDSVQTVQVQSPPTWGDEEEADFQRRLEEAKEVSLKENAATANGGDIKGNREAQANVGHSGGGGADEKAFEEELRKAMELSLAEEKKFEGQLLKAAAQWREGAEEGQ
jgi:hypothetical protein